MISGGKIYLKTLEDNKQSEDELIAALASILGIERNRHLGKKSLDN